MKPINSNQTNRTTGKATGIGIKAANPTKTGARGRKKKSVDNFDDLDMTWDADVQQEDEGMTSNWGRSRNNYNNDEDADSYEGTGYARSRSTYDSDEDLNDPYETFRRG